MLGGALVPSMLLPILVVLVLMVTPTLSGMRGSDDEGSAAVTSG